MAVSEVMISCLFAQTINYFSEGHRWPMRLELASLLAWRRYLLEKKKFLLIWYVAHLLRFIAKGGTCIQRKVNQLSEVHQLCLVWYNLLRNESELCLIFSNSWYLRTDFNAWTLASLLLRFFENMYCYSVIITVRNSSFSQELRECESFQWNLFSSTGCRHSQYRTLRDMLSTIHKAHSRPFWLTVSFARVLLMSTVTRMSTKCRDCLW